jgi:hypothetical protein
MGILLEIDEKLLIGDEHKVEDGRPHVTLS